MLMEHGDSRDGYVLDRKMLQHLGSWAVGALLDLDHWVFKERERLGIYSDFSYTIFGKQWVKDWLMDYRDRAVSSAQRRGADIVVVGHNHIAEMRYLDGTLYINTGDSQNPLHSNMVGVRALRTGQTQADIELLEWQRLHAPPVRTPFQHVVAASA